MAKMIPARIDDSVVSSAEKRVFDLLDTDPDTNGWTVLHSLGLARRRVGPYGEIDFVVVVPGEGIICLEVKGGRVSCEDGVWRTIDRHENVALLNKSPFMQARESMFALRNSVIEHFGPGSGEASCPFGYAVVLPDVTSPPPTPEFERSDVIDSDDLRRPISVSINRLIRGRLREFQPRSGGRLPAPSQCRAIQTYLRPDFDLVIAKSVFLGRTEDRLMSLTEEQYDRLDELEENPRCLFEGAAGTGKTLLALEYARRADRGGSKVLLVCFNRLLGDWLQSQTEDTQVTTGTWYEILKRMIVASSVGEEFLGQEQQALGDNDLVTLFEELYPLYGEIALDEMSGPFDVLVMDEGQDLFHQATLDLINRAIRGGLAGGTWAIFGDFTRQAIYGNSSEALLDLSSYCEHFVRARLTVNCRNTRRIAEEVASIGGFATPPFRFGLESGMPVEHRYWKIAPDLVRTLSGTIRGLVSDGVSTDDIVILSPRRLENSALASIEHIDDVPVVDCSRSMKATQPCIKFSTIHSFKGLESPVVIIVDIDEVDDDRSQSLLYVGMSRARSLLILMLQERVRGSIDARIRAALEKELRE